MKNARIVFLAVWGLGAVGALTARWNDDSMLRSYGMASVSSYIHETFSLAGIIDSFLVPIVPAVFISCVVWLVDQKKPGKPKA
ncbi:MAG: hypothetical protein NTX12_08915 [Actinobacteria bacterium]|nr:hypothetical protein [Actinomycetota bacterium]